MSLVNRFFPEDNEKKKELEKILGKMKLYNGIKNESVYANYIEKYRLYIQHLINDIIDFGFPHIDNTSNNSSINIVQLQTVNIDFFVSFFREMLSENQINIIKEVNKGEKFDENSKPKIIEKIKEFGIDITSKIITELITRPEIWNKLFS
jgi:hypothetical protein